MHSPNSADLSAEPTFIRQLTAEQKERLSLVLDHYLSALERELPIQPEQLLEANPDLAEPLSIYFDRLTDLYEVSAGFGNFRHDQPPPLPPGANARRLGDFLL